MRTARFRLAVAAAAVLVGVTLPAACSSSAPQHGATHSAAATTRPPATHTRSRAPRTHAPRHHRRHRRPHHRHRHVLRVDPLSGRRPVPAGPVLAVKVDDTAAARPQAAINSADVVYVEQVEGGLTRLLAVYAGAHPGEVGPVRSVRYSDLELLQEYGRIGLAYSGGAAGVVNAVHHADVIDSSPQRWGDAYHRSAAKPAPYNLMADSATLARHIGRFARVRDIGLRWGAARRAGRRVHSFSTRVGETPVGFVWHDGLHQWVRRIDGTITRQSDGAPVLTPNVIIQSCLVHRDPRDVDVAGNASAYTETVGSGRALVFTGGRVIDGRWSRPRAGAPTHYRYRGGKDITLHPGGVWIVLVARGAPVTLH